MYMLDDAVILSPSDVTRASGCEYAFLRGLDATLGWAAPPPNTDDEMLARAAAEGDKYEAEVTAAMEADYGTGSTGVVKAPGLRGQSLPQRRAAADATLDLLLSNQPAVVTQGYVFDGTLGGFADFLIREDSAEGAITWKVMDAKLARSAKVTALLQIAAYADLLTQAGVPVSPGAGLILGNGTTETFPLADLIPVYRHRRAHLEQMIATHRTGGHPVAWGDFEYIACGKCEVCKPEIERTRDPLLVAGITRKQRDALHAASITTMDALAALPVGTRIAGIGAPALAKITQQAALRVEQEALDSAHAAALNAAALDAASLNSASLNASANTNTTTDNAAEPARPLVPPVVVDLDEIARLPRPDAGDIFFDFEGDPLWTDGNRREQGLEYLFGVLELPATTHYTLTKWDDSDAGFIAFWAHDRTQERQALMDFLAYVRERRAQHPAMHIYHYAPYEKTALLRLAARHGVGEDEVDALLNAGVLVDLYATVRRSIRVGTTSYSIKYLEPYYMPGHRTGEVTNAGASIEEYARACELEGIEREHALKELANYNKYDVVSTLGLRDWLLGLAAERGAGPSAGQVGGSPLSGGQIGTGQVSGISDDDGVGASLDPRVDAGSDNAAPSPAAQAASDHRENRDALAEQMWRLAGEDPAHRSEPQLIAAQLASILQFWDREGKGFWQEHFDRMANDPDDWGFRRDTMLVDEAEIVTEWEPQVTRTGRASTQQQRVLRLVGTIEPGSALSVGKEVWGLHREPIPEVGRPRERYGRSWTENYTIEAIGEDATDGQHRDALTVKQTMTGKENTETGHYAEVPFALVPAKLRISSQPLEAAVMEVAEEFARSFPSIPHAALFDILQRTHPRHRRGDRTDPGSLTCPIPSAAAIAASVLDLDRSYVAVQGPPGTGKTFTGSWVISTLVAEYGWKVGVVSQGHDAVENLLDGVAKRGLVPRERIGKKQKTGDPRDPEELPWTTFGKRQGTRQQDFEARYVNDGYVIGGTSWGIASLTEHLDLLVVDEAGQYSLAPTAAVSGKAERLLLLGDPQQLPQVATAKHPENVDVSALEWIIDGHAVLPAERGVFLGTTWRMHPDLCRKVSDLSYDGQLMAEASTAARSLASSGRAPQAQATQTRTSPVQAPQTHTSPAQTCDTRPGVIPVPVTHTGNSTFSPQEVTVVVELVTLLLDGTSTWRDPSSQNPTDTAGRPLTPQDVLVVAPYNAQVNAIRDALVEAGQPNVAVGTVDKFQGQEAPIVIVSLAASSSEDAPRGLEFLLNRNRLNVAISRAQWCAYVVHSPALLDSLPTSPERLQELGAFCGLVT
ncbi:MAG: TM0106 family RecB-like putative nuclease [Cellulomonadaceae bacterium]|jgi:uncharacterized protein|nr:TM0106 family RecB-like putative nuclease [Cellulomonadaceae bacterium]